MECCRLACIVRNGAKQFGLKCYVRLPLLTGMIRILRPLWDRYSRAERKVYCFQANAEWRFFPYVSSTLAIQPARADDLLYHSYISLTEKVTFVQSIKSSNHFEHGSSYSTFSQRFQFQC